MVNVAETSNAQVALLHRISSIVSSDQDIDSILQEMVSLIMKITASDACLVYLIDHATNEIVLRASQLPHDEEIGNVRLKMGEGITGAGWQPTTRWWRCRKMPGRIPGSSRSAHCRKIISRLFFPCRWWIPAKPVRSLTCNTRNSQQSLQRRGRARHLHRRADGRRDRPRPAGRALPQRRAPHGDPGRGGPGDQRGELPGTDSAGYFGDAGGDALDSAVCSILAGG